MRLIFVAFLLTSIALASCEEAKMPAPFSTGMEGKALPAFSIQLLDSVSWWHSNDIPQNKYLIIFYFSPTCLYCRAQMRDMVNNIETFKDAQLCVLTDARLHSVRQFAKYFELDNYKDVIVGRDTGKVIRQKYRPLGVPFTAYFDKNKNLKVAYAGRLTSHSLLNIK